MGDKAFNGHFSDSAAAEAANAIVERTRNKVEIAVRLPGLVKQGSVLLQSTVNITDDEIALLARVYSDLELRDSERAVLGEDTRIPDSQFDEEEEDLQVRRVILMIQSNSSVWKIVRENRREMSQKAMDFVRRGGKFPCDSVSERYHVEHDEFAWSKGTTASKTASSLSSSTPKIKRTIRRYQPRVEKLTTASNIRQSAKSSDKSNAELLKFYSHLENNTSQIRDHQLQMEKLIKKHLVEEKSARAEKDKAETELVACLKVYDEEVGTLQALLEGESAELEVEKKQMVILEENFRVQQILYEQLMAEKLAEYQRELKEKMFIFVCNRAALRIQRYWRAYRERKLAKKKRKGRKGKAGSGGKTTKN